MGIVVPGLAAALLSFLVSTQIDLLHRLGPVGLAVSFVVVWLLLMAADLFLSRRRFEVMARIGTMFLLFVIVWVLNSALPGPVATGDTSTAIASLAFDRTPGGPTRRRGANA
jgi:hypothetical protein